MFLIPLNKTKNKITKIKLFHIILLSWFFGTISYAQPSQDQRRLDSIGAVNAVKKAHQLTDLPICPVRTFSANQKKTYYEGKTYHGAIYSSVKELNSFIGQDVSIHTFMTALQNPQSVLYTVRVDRPPYHGVNCMAYYGTVCSGLINYALGFKVTQRSEDILVEDCFELIKDQSARGIQLADLVCRKGHPAMVTGIERDSKGIITRIEISSARQNGCRRLYYEGEEEFDSLLHNKNLQIYRYKYLYKNVSYTPFTGFVAVDGETLIPFKYNDVICANKGDKSCYVTGEDVVLNVYGGGKKIEIFKDLELFREIDIQKRDTNLVLKNYPYGDYQARVVDDNNNSDYTKWKIIDVDVSIDKENGRIYFNSSNATPVYYEFCSASGSRPANKNRVYAAEFTNEEIKKGYVNVQAPNEPAKGKRTFPYVKVHFECEYGMVINKPINWYE